MSWQGNHGAETSDAPPGARWDEALESWRARVAVLAVILLATFLVYSQALLFGFVYDDTPQIIQNQYVHGWSHWTELFHVHVWAQQFGAGNYYRPLFVLLLLIEYSLFGLRTFGWHLVSIALHLGATAAVYSLAAQFARARWAAFLVALLFGIYPIHVESVAWVSAVSDPLFAVFAISSVVCYIHFRRKETRAKTYLAASLALFTCALFTKETSVILVPILAIYEWLFPRKESRNASQNASLFKSWTPLLVFIAVFAAYASVRFSVLGAFRRQITILPWQDVVYTAPRTLLFYLQHLVWPFNLSLFYDVRYATAPDLRSVLLPAVALAAVLLAFTWLLWRSRSRPIQFFAWWLLLPLLPVLDFRSFPPGDIVHDRYLYLPSVGFAVLIALVAERISVRLNRKLFLPAVSFLLLMVIFLAAMTVHESLPWANNLALYFNAVERAPHSARARNALANELFERQMYPQAIAEYKMALVDDPNSFASNYNLGVSYRRLGKVNEAAEFFERAGEINPNRGDVWISLAECHIYKNELAAAETAILHALEIDPSGLGYHIALGDLRLLQGKLPAALEAYETEMHLHPGVIEARIKAADVRARMQSEKSPQTTPRH